MKEFRTLKVALDFYRMTQSVSMPKHLKEQFDRAASSISLNLAEGNAKFSYKDKARIYQIAYGSLRECQTVLELANVTDPEILAVSKHLGSSMYRLVTATIERGRNQNNPPS